MASRVFLADASWGQTIWKIDPADLSVDTDTFDEFSAGYVYASFGGVAQFGDYGYFVYDRGNSGANIYAVKVNLRTFTAEAEAEITGTTGPNVLCFNACVDTTGAFLYIHTSDASGYVEIHRVDLNDFTFDSTLDLTADWEAADRSGVFCDAMVCDADYLYVGAVNIASGNAHILRIQLSDFTFVDSLNTESSGYTRINSGTVEGASVYFGATDLNNATSSAVVLKVNRAAFTITSALAIKDTDTDDVDWVASITSDGTHLYAATAGINAPQEKSVLGKVQLSDFTVASTAYYSTDTSIRPRPGVIIGGALFLVRYRLEDVGATENLWKIDTSDLSVLDSEYLALRGTPYSPNRLLGNALSQRPCGLYVAGQGSNYIGLSRFDLDTLHYGGTLETSLNGTTEWLVGGVSDGTHGYFASWNDDGWGGGSVVSKIVKINLATLTEVDTADLTKVHYQIEPILAIDVDAGYLYVTGENRDNVTLTLPKTIARVTLSDLTVTSYEIDADYQAFYPNVFYWAYDGMFIDATGQQLYLMGDDDDMTARQGVAKFDIPTVAFDSFRETETGVDATAFYPGPFGFVYGGCVYTAGWRDTDGDNTINPAIQKYDPSGPTTTYLELDETTYADHAFRSAILDESAGFAYFGTMDYFENDSPSIVKVDLSDFSVDSSAEIGDAGAWVWGFQQTATHLYAAVGTDLLKIDKSTLTVDATADNVLWWPSYGGPGMVLIECPLTRRRRWVQVIT